MSTPRKALKLRGKVVIVTGAGSGIGAALADLLLREGAFVVLAGRRRGKLEELKDKSPHPEHALAVATDITKYGDLKRLIEFTQGSFGKLDVLINNAGVGFGGALSDLDPGEVEHVVKVNLVAPMWLTQLALPLLAERPWGMVVNVSSLSAKMALPNQAPYCASKLGLLGFTASLRRELHGSNIHVMDVCPGTVETELLPPAAHRKLRAMAFTNEGFLSAQEAAAGILSGMKARRSSIDIAKSHERMLVRMNKWLPLLVEQSLKKMAPRLREVMLEVTRTERIRNQVPKVS